METLLLFVPVPRQQDGHQLLHIDTVDLGTAQHTQGAVGLGAQ